MCNNCRLCLGACGYTGIARQLLPGGFWRKSCFLISERYFVYKELSKSNKMSKLEWHHCRPCLGGCGDAGKARQLLPEGFRRKSCFLIYERYFEYKELLKSNEMPKWECEITVDHVWGDVGMLEYFVNCFLKYFEGNPGFFLRLKGTLMLKSYQKVMKCLS